MDQFNEALPTKGILHFSVSWEPDALDTEDGLDTKFVVGDERVIVANRPLVLREGLQTSPPPLLFPKLFRCSLTALSSLTHLELSLSLMPAH